MSKVLKKSIFAGIFLAVSMGAAGAQTAISLNMTNGDEAKSLKTDAATIAGAVEAAYWENATVIPATKAMEARGTTNLSALKDSTGLATTVTAGFTSTSSHEQKTGTITGTFEVGSTNSSNTMMSSFVTSSNNASTYTFSNLNSFAAVYDVYIYSDHANSNAWAGFKVGSSEFWTASNSGGINGPFALSSYTSSATAQTDKTTNYVKFSGLTLNTLQIQVLKGRHYAPVNGIQIVKSASNVPPAKPVATAAETVTNTNFTATWNVVGNTDSYSVEYADNNAFTSSTVVNNISGTNQVCAKSGNVTYYYRVAAKNTHGTSDWSSVITVLPYEDIAAGSTVSFNNGIPEGWAVVDNGGDKWGTSHSGNASWYPADNDGKYASCYFDKPNNDWLVSPAVTVGSSGSTLTFKGFNGYVGGDNAARSFKVKVALTSAASQTSADANFKDVFTTTTGHADNNFEAFSVVIKEAGGTDFKGQAVYIAIVYDGNDGRALSVDDIKFSQSVTPAIGLKVSRADNELCWTVEDEVDVKEYRVVNAETKAVIEVVLAVDADAYSVAVPDGVAVELVVVDHSGFSKSYLPQDGSKVTEVYTLKEGWNLIAVTCENADLTPLKEETVGVIWGWNRTSYEATDAVEATGAVWVYSPKAKRVYVTGTRSEAEIQLDSGWNMVGPTKDAYIPEDADTVYAWSTVYDVIAGNEKVLIGGKGYWIFGR